jgi:hypothetical protein
MARYARHQYQFFQRKKMKKILWLIASLIAMVFLAACGPTGTKNPVDGNKKPVVSIEITGTLEEGQSITLKANASDSDGQVVSYSWSGAVSGNTKSISQVFAAGTYTVSVTVTDDDGATATTSKTFTVVDKPRTRLEEIYGIDNLKKGDNVYWDGNAFVKTSENCQYQTIDVGNGEELDATSIEVSNLKLHFSITETEVDGDIIIGCSLDTYQVSDQYNDMIIAKYTDTTITIILISAHSAPNNQGWAGTNEELEPSKFIK